MASGVRHWTSGVKYELTEPVAPGQMPVASVLLLSKQCIQHTIIYFTLFKLHIFR